MTKPKAKKTLTVQQEKGKKDIVAAGPGEVTQVPEGTGPQFASVPEEKHPREDDHGGWINGEPATREEVEASTK